MKIRRKRKLSAAVVVAIAAVMVLSLLAPVSAVAAKVAVPDDRVYITSKQYTLVTGATETVLTTNNEDGDDQRIGYLLEVDPDYYADSDNQTIKIVAAYKDYSYDSLGLQTVTDQAAAYEAAHPGETVIAGINADFFNMTTGEPSGAFVMEGTVYHSANSRPYFAILKDGTAVIRTDSDLSDVWEAVAGNEIIVTNGENTAGTSDYDVTKYSRTAIGIKADGTVVTYVTHGISKPTSCGETYSDVADLLIAQGCETAIMLDGGGSSTYASLREGTDVLTVQNSPSDGTPRTVSTTLLVVSTASSDGKFDHASLSPNNEYYTPSTENATTTVQFEATGIDASGSACDLPDQVTWALTADSVSMGTIDTESGLFTANEGVTGTVGVELICDNEVVGSTEIQLVEPDELYFSSDSLSLDFSEETDLGLVIRGDGVSLNIKDGDLTWEYASSLGTVDDNIFISAAKTDETLEGEVTVSYTRADATVLSATISLEIGKLPVVVLDFEDYTTDDDVVGLQDWGNSTSYFTDATETQVYSFQTYDYLYYVQSTTYSSDSQWINEEYSTDCPWVENDDDTVTVTYNGETYVGTKTEYYGEYTEESEGTGTGTANKWVEFSDENGAEYYIRVLYKNSSFSGSYNASKSAAAILGADNYIMYVWHTSACKNSLDNLIGDGSGVVDNSTGEVRFGESALKLTYDFSNFSPTGSTKNCNIYYKVTDAVVAEGSPTGLGMWVYAPEGMSNYWFWTYVSYWDGSSWTGKYIHFKVSGAEKTLQYSGINWTGWAYVEADLSSIYEAGAVVDEDHPIQVRAGSPMLLLTYIPGGTSDGEGHAIVCGSATAGYFYIDNVRWVYGTTVDDLDNPEIVSVTANETELTTDETVELDTNTVSFDISFTDPQGENYSGIDETGTQLYLDGSVLTSDQYAATADRAQTVEMTLANGEHTLTVSICDNFGNKTEQTYYFVVSNEDSSLPEIMITRETDAELGADYVIDISTADFSDIASVSLTITYGNTDILETESKTLSNSKFYDDYGNELTLGSDGNYYTDDGVLIEEPMRPSATGEYAISSAALTLSDSLTLSGNIRNKSDSFNNRIFTATATVNEDVTGAGTIATFTLPVPHTLAETDTVPYTATVIFTTVDGESYTVTTGSRKASLWAYYTIDAGVQISGAQDSTLTISAADDSDIDADSLGVYGDADTEITDTGSFSGNVFTTTYFTGQEAGSTFDSVWVGDEENQHYSFYTSVSVASAAESDIVHYDLTLNASTDDTSTTQRITWFSTPESTGEAIVQYLTSDAYEAALAEASDTESDEIDYDTVFSGAAEVSGTAELTQFGADLVAAYINNVTVTGLASGTTYYYRAGDGSSWSEVSSFSTYDSDGTETSFVVVGDTQLTGSESADADAIQLINNIGNAVSGFADFGIQTGDYVDGGIQYSLWDQIMGVWSIAFNGLDFVHVQGNHETYGTAGSGISAALFGLDDSETAYYSVEYGNVYIAVINQSADLTEAAAWLAEDAAQSNCTWKILTCHQPIYYTNPNGSSDGHHNVLAPACDEAGIDIVFSGHDHSYARTEQQMDGVAVDLDTDDETNAYLDENGDIAATQGMGTVYFICGDLGEKSRESSYAIVNNTSFNFAATSQDYNALYLTVTANENSLTVKAWDMSDEGDSTLLDTYTMYTGTGACDANGEHVITEDEVKYNPETGMLICDRCGEEIDPEEVSYTGYAVDVNGEDDYGDSQYYFLAGTLKTGFFAMGEEFLYANEDGLIDHATENYDTNTCTVNGNHMAYSPRYDKTYTGGIARYTGHVYVEQEDGSRVCSVCGHTAVDIADWEFSLAYTSATYTGKAKTPAITIKNPETGETLTFHTDGTGIISDYTRVWSNNKNVGTASVTIEANNNGDYYNSNGAVVLYLSIRPALPTDVEAVAGEVGTVNLTWTASGSADSYTVYYSTDGSKWTSAGTTEDTSYEVTGLAQNTVYYFRIRSQATVDGKTYNSLGYTDAVTATTAMGYDLSEYTVTTAWTTAVYTGSEKKPAVTVTDSKGAILTKGTDYTVTYSNNVNVGTATVTVEGCGDYYGTAEAEFKITQRSLTSHPGTLTAEDTVYTPGSTETTLTVLDDSGIVLVEGTDYTVSYADNTEVGRATVKVSGIGNYKGSMSTTFLITQADIADFDAVADGEYYYTGNEQTPNLVVSGLEEGVDYSIVSCSNNIEVGTAVVTIAGIGNFTGTMDVEFAILPSDLAGSEITDGSTYSYTGSEIEADISIVSSNGALLVEGEDYEIAGYTGNVNVGIAAVEIQGIGNYSGTITHEFEIQAADVSSFTVALSKETYTYSGSDRVPDVTVTSTAGTVLEEDADYTVEMADNRNAGTATVTVTGIGNYSGTAVKYFTITPADLTKCTAELEQSSYTYSGADRTPAVTVTTAKGTKLKKGTNYTVTYSNNRNAGIAMVTISGINNYSGEIVKEFTINQADLSKCTVTLSENEFYADGTEKQPAVTVKTAKGTTLAEGTNYSVEYVNNVEAGTAEVVLTGINNYNGTLTESFKIKAPRDLSDFSATLNWTLTTYTGNEKRPGITVKTPNGTTLKKNVNYTVTYSDNVEVGIATVTVTGIGKYTGTIEKTFKIRPVVPTNLAVSSKTKTTVKVTFDRSDTADKYYIYVDGVYTGCAKTVDYYTIKGLTAGTTYKITVKAVKVVDGVNIYSSASKAVTVTTNK